MSSPYVPFQGESQEQNVAFSPAVSPVNNWEQQEPSLRPMRLKVLYSFDTENKTNCLAKWPEILNIRTAYLDEKTQIGVIELKTCIQAILTASPELDCKYGLDYTIYAYDYSEYETPLVGQGMLSRALASISSTPSAPAHESDTIVTGRVSRTPLGLFGNGIHEVLEVKLRLVPVPTRLQNQYVETMKQQRDLNQVIPEGCDPRVWQEFMKQNPGMVSVLTQNRSLSPSISIGQPQHGIEQVQRLVNEGYRPQSAHRTASYAGSAGSGASNRSGSPTPSFQSMTTSQQFTMNNRPVSRASDNASSSRIRRPSLSASADFAYDDDRLEEGPQRKRAKVMKADHPGRSSLGKVVDSLRVTASAAASVRVFQPSAVRPPIQNIQSLEGPPRAPTPTPGSGASSRRFALKPSKSNLAYESTMTSDSGYRSLTSDDGAHFAESNLSSPENVAVQSDYNSPEEVASSPPIMRNPAVSVAPSSPMLPAMPMVKATAPKSGSFSSFGDTSVTQRPWIDENSRVAARYSNKDLPQRPSSAAPMMDSDGPDLLKDPLNEEARQREISMRNARRAIGLKRAQTWSEGHPSSDPAPVELSTPSEADPERPKSRTKNWNKEKRKAAMQSKLNESIEAGQMPQFCENCGAIETPTWRKAYSRIYSGDPADLRAQDEDGAILFVQVLETNEAGSTKLFKIFRKVVPSGEEGFSDVVLCNPCGIWLSNHKSMRPETHWGKRRPKGDKSKEKRSRGKKRQDDSKSDDSDALNAPSEAINPASEMSVDLDDRTHELGNRASMAMDGPRLPPIRMDLSLEDPFTDGFSGLDTDLNANDVAALERAIRASPGTMRKSPRSVEKQSGDPARRTLFPSPKSDGPLGVNIDDRGRPGRCPPKTPNERRASSTDGSHSDKENESAEKKDGEDSLSDILPVTPSRKSDTALTLRKHALEMKTPLLSDSPSRNVLTTGDFFSSAAKAYLHAPQTPSRTPTRNSNANPSPEERMTPFARHLNQLLGDNHGDGKSDLEDLNLPPLTDHLTPGRALTHAAFDFGDYSSDLPNFGSSPGWFEMPDGVYDESALGENWRTIWASAEKARPENKQLVAHGEGEESLGSVRSGTAS